MMVNGNDMVEHQESCDFCIDLLLKLEAGEITEEEANEALYLCFNQSQEAE